jgi:pyroglutamyl-peptidase
VTSRILVTGYEPFGGRDVNPTQQLVTALAKRSLPGVDLHTAVLPVVYDACVDALLTEVERIGPDAVIACGLAAGRTAVTPERVAINVKGTSADPAHTDNAGTVRRRTDR